MSDARRKKRVRFAMDLVERTVPGAREALAGMNQVERRKAERTVNDMTRNLELLFTLDVSGGRTRPGTTKMTKPKLTAAEKEQDLYATMVASGVAHNLFQLGFRQIHTPWGAILSMVGIAGLASLGTLAAAQFIELELEAARSGVPRQPAPGMRPLLELLDQVTPGKLPEPR